MDTSPADLTGLLGEEGNEMIYVKEVLRIVKPHKHEMCDYF